MVFISLVTSIMCHENVQQGLILVFVLASIFNSNYGYSGAQRHSKYFQCTGSEFRLSQCQSFNETRSRRDGYDIGIACSEGKSKSLDQKCLAIEHDC